MTKMIEATALVNARATTIWDVLTDTSNVTVWESGISAIDREIRHGAWIRIRTHDSPKSIRLRVQQLPGHIEVCGMLSGDGRCDGGLLSSRRGRVISEGKDKAGEW